MGKFWNFRADANAPEDGVLDVRGVLTLDGSWFEGGAITAREFRSELDKYRNVTVVINSPGGDVMAGAEMYSALRAHSAGGKGRVTVHVTALAASAASVVAMAGDEVLMSPVAYMMIHNPWSVIAGNAGEMRHEADVLDEIAEGIITAYQLKTGRSRSKIREMMEAESYMDARRCVRDGFADGLLYADDGAMNQEQEPGETDGTAATDDEDGVLMRARDFGFGHAVACAKAHGMRLNPLRILALTDAAEDLQGELEAQLRAEIARRASMIASLASLM